MLINELLWCGQILLPLKRDKAASSLSAKLTNYLLLSSPWFWDVSSEKALKTLCTLPTSSKQLARYSPWGRVETKAELKGE